MITISFISTIYFIVLALLTLVVHHRLEDKYKVFKHTYVQGAKLQASILFILCVTLAILPIEMNIALHIILPILVLAQIGQAIQK